MKNKILSGWDFRRVFYTIIGLYIMVQSGLEQQWIGLLLGGYFAAMGVFAFCCASGNCGGGACKATPDRLIQSDSETVGFEEVK